MPDRHIAFINFPHHPHIGPTLPVVSTLVRRGFRVSYVTCERFASRVAQTGAEVVRSPTRASVLNDELNRLGDMFCLWTTRVLPQITAFYERNRPDLIVYDFAAFAGRVLVTKWGLPAIQMSPVYALDRDTLAQQTGSDRLSQTILDYSKSLDPFFGQLGINGGSFFFHREKLNIHWFPRMFQPAGVTLDESLFYAGRCAGEQPHYGDWRRERRDERPIALISASSTHLQGADHFKMCIEAFAGLPWHVVLSIGDDANASSLGQLPPQFEIAQRTSHVSMLRYASLFVFSGGAISAAEAAYHGVPSIALTTGSMELEWLADGFERLGLAAHLKSADTTAATLRSTAIRIAADAALHRSVKEIRRTVQREPGGEETANRIEAYLESGS